MSKTHPNLILSGNDLEQELVVIEDSDLDRFTYGDMFKAKLQENTCNECGDKLYIALSRTSDRYIDMSKLRSRETFCINGCINTNYAPMETYRNIPEIDTLPGTLEAMYK